MSVAIIDYGSGNLHSAAKAFERAARSMDDGQKIFVTSDPDQAYGADRLVLRCPAWQTSPGCTPDAVGLVADVVLTAAGDYQLVTITSVNVDPAGVLDRDLAAVVDGGGDYRLTDLSVR